MRRRSSLLALVILAACQADSPTDLMVTPSFSHLSGSLDCARPLDSATDDACFSPGAIEDGVTFSTVGPDRAGKELLLVAIEGDLRLLSSRTLLHSSA